MGRRRVLSRVWHCVLRIRGGSHGWLVGDYGGFSGVHREASVVAFPAERYLVSGGASRRGLDAILGGSGSAEEEGLGLLGETWQTRVLGASGGHCPKMTISCEFARKREIVGRALGRVRPQ